MKKFVMSYKKLFGITIIIVLAVLFQLVARNAILGLTNSWEGTPVFAGWNDKGEDIAMKILCNGKEASTKNIRLIMSQLTSPDKPLPTVYLYEDGSVTIKKE